MPILASLEALLHHSVQVRGIYSCESVHSVSKWHWEREMEDLASCTAILGCPMISVTHPSPSLLENMIPFGILEFFPTSYLEPSQPIKENQENLVPVQIWPPLLLCNQPCILSGLGGVISVGAENISSHPKCIHLTIAKLSNSALKIQLLAKLNWVSFQGA